MFRVNVLSVLGNIVFSAVIIFLVLNVLDKHVPNEADKGDNTEMVIEEEEVMEKGMSTATDHMTEEEGIDDQKKTKALMETSSRDVTEVEENDHQIQMQREHDGQQQDLQTSASLDDGVEYAVKCNEVSDEDYEESPGKNEQTSDASKGEELPDKYNNNVSTGEKEGSRNECIPDQDEEVSEEDETDEPIIVDDEEGQEKVSVFKALQSAYVSDSCAIELYDGSAETFTVFAEEHNEGFVMNALCSLNLWGNGVTDVVFNSDKLKSLCDGSTLRFMTGLANGTGDKTDCTLNIYLNDSEKPNISKTIKGNAAPTEIMIDLEDVRSMRFELINNALSSAIQVGFFDFDMK